MGTISDKLTYLDTTKTQIKNAINNVGANITNDTFRSYANTLNTKITKIHGDRDVLIGNSIIGTSTGSITNALDYPIYEDKMSKLSTQDGTPTPSNPVEVKTVKGYKNLFDKTLTGIIVSNRLKTEILPTGIRVICNIRETSSQANNAVRYVTIDVTNYIGKKITLFCHAKSSSTNKGFFYLKLGKQNGDTTSDYPTQNSSETLDGDLSVTYTIPSGIGDYHYLIVAIYGNRNSACEINDYVDYTNIMLVEGENNFPYVSYGTNWMYTKITGKNLFVKTSVTANKYLDVNGNLNDNVVWVVSDYIRVNPGETIYYKGLTQVGTAPYSVYYDINKNFISSFKQAIGNQTLTIPSNVYYIRFSVNQSENFLDINTFQVERNIITSYEEGKENIITIPLNNNEIAGIGDYKDELIVDKNGHCWLNKQTGKIVLNGSETGWVYDSASAFPFRLVVDGSNSKNSSNDIAPLYMSNYYSAFAWNTSPRPDVGITATSNSNRLVIRNTNITSLADFKTWLSTHNTDVYYVLAEESLIDLNYNVDLTLYEGINNITNSEDMDMAIKYVEDINTILATLTTPSNNGGN